MASCFKKYNECASHLVFKFLMACSVKEIKQCSSHLVFVFLSLVTSHADTAFSLFKNKIYFTCHYHKILQGLTYLGSLIQISLCWLELELLISADVSAIFATLDWQLYNTGTLQKRQWQWLKLVLVISHDQPDCQFEQTIFS